MTSSIHLSKIIPLIVSGPSGCGKTTLISHILSIYPSQFELSVSHTTRKPRSKEKDGFHYYFTSKEAFERMIESNDFLEFEDVHGKYYGTSKTEITRITANSKIPLLDIDIKGAVNIHKNGKLKEANYLFVMTKDIETLRNRLIKRGTETQESLNIRVNNALKEIKMARESKIYKDDDFIYNEDLECSQKDFMNKIKALYQIAS